MNEQTIGIIGTGHIGATLAKHFVDAGHRVLLANSRGADSLRSMAAELGPSARASTPAEAAREADFVVEAVPFGKLEDLPRAELAGKLLVSASNYYPGRDGDLDIGADGEAAYIGKLFPETRVVRAFNTVYWEHLRDKADPSLSHEDRRAVPVAGDDPQAVEKVAEFVESLGFGAVRVGALRDTHGVSNPGGALYNVDMTAGRAERVLRERTNGPAR
ncbi:MAG: NADPH-dependent F420 reductase [Nannocystaceae bacterium]|nr:NAD(P)-binding domain-containing protein [bacterium]